MWVVNVPISYRHPGFERSIWRMRASVPTITIERRIEARELTVGSGRLASGIASDATRG